MRLRHTLLVFVFATSPHLLTQPKISLSTDKIDLGTMYRGEVRQTKFSITNIGSEPLKILQVLPSCGCTALKKPKETLLPGEEDFVEVEFSSASFRGRVEHKRIDIQSNDPLAEYVFVSLTADVREELVPVENGPSLIWFGTVAQGTTTEQKITYQNISEKTISIRKLISSSPRLKASNSKKRLKPQDTVEITVSITADKEGYTSDHVDMETDSDKQSTVRINISFIGVKGS